MFNKMTLSLALKHNILHYNTQQNDIQNNDPQ